MYHFFVFVGVGVFSLQVVLYSIFCFVSYFYVGVFLNNLVMFLVSFLTYVNDAHFCFCIMLGVLVLFCFVLCLGMCVICSCYSAILFFMCCIFWYLLLVETLYMFILLVR
jgi:hypothetical protein